MDQFDTSNYHKIFEQTEFSGKIKLVDHLNGFDSGTINSLLDHINQHSQRPVTVGIDYVFENNSIPHYQNLKFRWQPTWVNDCFQQYNQHPEVNHKNFLCSFNGSPHVSRKLLVAILHKMGWFSAETCSKNFIYDENTIDGHLFDFVGDDLRFYSKFFIGDRDAGFNQSIFSFGHVRFNHRQNIYNLEKKLTSSFLQLVSESMSTSYYPFVTEKFFYSVITRGLFLAYAQPGWHDHVQRYYGFRKYDKIFDYRFDSIQNPVERLVELMSMIAKFSVLSSDDWRDLYEIEMDTIEYNYDHYFSKQYMNCLQQNHE